MSTILPHMVWP